VNFHSWGTDLGCEDTQLQTILDFTVRFEKKVPLNGREPLLAQRDEPLSRPLVVFTREDPEPLPYDDEPTGATASSPDAPLPPCTGHATPDDRSVWRDR